VNGIFLSTYDFARLSFGLYRNMHTPRDSSSASLRDVNHSRMISTDISAQQLTFQTTIRSLSCGEIADDLELVSRIKHLYDKLDTGTTPSTILLPWLPSWTMAKKLWSTKEIYDIIVDAVKKRQELLTTISEGEKPQDTMQILLDAGDDRMAVVGVSHYPGFFFLAVCDLASWSQHAHGF
jgi:hypothetical protein